jgi:hypothetical protein
MAFGSGFLGAEHHVDLVGDGGDLFRRGAFPADEARRSAPQCGFRISDPVRHLALQHRQAGVGELRTDVLGDDGVAGGLRQQTTEQRPFAIGAVGEDAQRVEHAVDVERRRFYGDQQEIRGHEAIQRRSGAKARRVDDHQTATGGDAPRRLGGVFSRVLDHGDTAERPFARNEPHDRPLRIGVD